MWVMALGKGCHYQAAQNCASSYSLRPGSLNHFLIGMGFVTVVIIERRGAKAAATFALHLADVFAAKAAFMGCLIEGGLALVVSI